MPSRATTAKAAKTTRRFPGPSRASSATKRSRSSAPFTILSGAGIPLATASAPQQKTEAYPMKLPKVAVLTLGMAAAFAAGAQADKFRSMDANGDGFVSREEAHAVPGFQDAFDEADENRDGRLDADEFVKADSLFLRQSTGNYVS